MSKPVIQIDFAKTAKARKPIGGGLYRREADKSFWERPHVGGRRTWRKLVARTESKAREELARKRSEQGRARIGLALDPYATAPAASTVKELAEFYLSSGCPKRGRDESPRAGVQLEEEQDRVARLVEFFGKRSWQEVALDHCREYHRWRVGLVKRKGATGNRTVDLELGTLSTIFRWALRNQKRTGVTSNPLAHDRIRFADSRQVRHCRECQPRNGDELHLLAATLFEEPRSAALGWQTLLEAFIGHRTSELVRLRWDAAPQQPGWIDRDAKGAPKVLWLYQSATHKGTCGFIDVHSALRQALEALQEWRAEWYPNTPWFFPSFRFRGERAVKSDALTKALGRICPLLKLPHVTSHGLRSYHVNVLRSRGISDAEIAVRIGHKTGGKLIVEVYGEKKPGKLSWMPEHREPAWIEVFAGRKPVQLELGL